MKAFHRRFNKQDEILEQMIAKLDKLEQLLNNRPVPASVMQMQMTERIVTER